VAVPILRQTSQLAVEVVLQISPQTGSRFA